MQADSKLTRLDILLPYLTVTTMVFYLFRSIFWPFTFLFVPSFAILLGTFIFRFSWRFHLAGFFSGFRLPSILAFIFIFAFIIYGPFFNVVIQKDVIRILITFTLFYLLFWCNTILKSEIPFVFALNVALIIILSLSTLNLLKLLFPGLMPQDALDSLHISGEATLSADYNFYSLYIIMGLLILDHKITKLHDRIYLRIIAMLGGILLLIDILLSGSKRGLMALGMIAIIYAANLFVRNARNPKKPLILKALLYALVSGGVLLLSIYILYQRIPEQYTAGLLSRYFLIRSTNNRIFVEKYKWRGKPVVPEESGCIIPGTSFAVHPDFWGAYRADGTILSFVETPYGRGVNVVRESGGPVGFSLFYKGPKIVYLANHTYQITCKIRINQGDLNSMNLGWWVNDGEQGRHKTLKLETQAKPLGNGWYSCMSRYTFIDNHIGIEGFVNSVPAGTDFTVADFKLSDLDFDPKLPRFFFEFDTDADPIQWLEYHNPPLYGDSNLLINGNFKLDARFWGCNAREVMLTPHTNDSTSYLSIERGSGFQGGFSLYYAGRAIDFLKDNEYRLEVTFKPVHPPSVPFLLGFWDNDSGGFNMAVCLDKRSESLADGWIKIKARYRFRENLNDPTFPIHSQLENSLFLVSEVRLVNLTQTQVISDQLLADSSTHRNIFYGRIARWKFGYHLWKSEYRLFNKLFGGGFVYMNRYGEKFYGNAGHYDWPHNPFLTILLYSGVFGLIFYILLLSRALAYFFRYRRYRRLFLFFGLTFFFAFFSAGNPFDPPIMGFMIMIPYYLNIIEKH